MIKPILLTALTFGPMVVGSLVSSPVMAQYIDLSSQISISPIEQFLNNLWDEHPFQYYSQAQRIQVIQELKNAFKRGYAAWDVKKIRLGVDLEEVFDNAIAAEKEIADSELIDVQAFANVEFLNRILLLKGQIKDTHVTIVPNKDAPVVQLGIYTKLIGDKLYITGRDKRILNYIAERYPDSKINSVDWNSNWQLESIDGQKAKEKMIDLSHYISASSEEYAYEEAAYALTFRSFSYPQKSISEVVIYNQEKDQRLTLKLPWFQYLTKKVASENKYRPDVAWFFKLKGYASIEAPATDWVSENGNAHKLRFGSLGHTDYDNWDYPAKLKDARHYYDNKDEDESVLQTGHFLVNGQSLAYIKLNTFNQESVFDKESEEQVDLIDILTSFIKDIQSEDLGIIVDVRYNGGGSPKLAYEVASLLSTQGLPSPTHANYRINPAIIDYIFNEQFTGHLEQKDQWTIDELETVKSAFEQNIPYSLPFQRVIDSDTGINSLPFIVLTGPNCISACDGFNWVIKDNNIAPLIGRPSNGTGAGFVDNKYYFSEDYWKDTQSIVKANIPNRLFGRPIPAEKIEQLDNQSWVAYNTENVPAPVDIEYQPTINDYKFQDEELMGHAKKELLKYIQELNQESGQE